MSGQGFVDDRIVERDLEVQNVENIIPLNWRKMTLKGIATHLVDNGVRTAEGFEIAPSLGNGVEFHEDTRLYIKPKDYEEGE